MDTVYQTDGVNSYMILNGSRPISFSYEVHMIQNNDIEGLIPFEFRSLNNDIIIYYRVTGYISLSEILSIHNLAFNYMKNMLVSLIKLMTEMDNYLLHPDCLIIDMNTIYYNKVNDSFAFIFLPEYNMNIRKQIRTLMEECIKHINHRDHQIVDMAYGIYDIVTRKNYDVREITEHIKLYEKLDESVDEIKEGKIEQKEKTDEQEKLMDMLFSKEEEIVFVNPDDMNDNSKINYKKVCIIALILTGITGIIMTFVQINAAGHVDYIKLLMGIMTLMAVECYVYLQLTKHEQGEASDDIPVVKPKLVKADVDYNIAKPKPVASESYYGVNNTDFVSGADTNILKSDANTTLLVSGDKKIVSYKLVPCVNDYSVCEGEINIYSIPIIIGRDKIKANYIINDNAISRTHAMAHIEDEKLVVEDMNSTNGTFVNFCRLESGQPVTVHKGDVVSFGNISYSVADA